MLGICLGLFFDYLKKPLVIGIGSVGPWRALKGNPGMISKCRMRITTNSLDDSGSDYSVVVNSARSSREDPQSTTKRPAINRRIGKRNSRQNGGQVRLTVQTSAEQLTPSARLVEVCLRFGTPMSVPSQQIVSPLR